MESRFSLSNVLSGTFSTIGGNPLATLGVAFLIGVLPPQILSLALVGSTVVNRGQLFTTTTGILLYIALLLVSIFCSILVQATLVRVTVAHARGEKVSIGTSIAVGLTKLLPLLGLTILMTLALMVAGVALLVPAIILYIMWCVAAPALVAEDIGVLEAFGRSRALTKGNRWKIFGLFLVLVVILWVFFALVTGIFLATGIAPSIVAGMAETGTVPILFMLFSAVANTLMTAVMGALVARLYLELRTAKEGPMTDALADVFA